MVRAKDPIGTRGWVIDIPRLKFANANPTVSGVDTDRMLDTPFQALQSPTFGYSLSLQRFEEHV
jgi:hypothetical protein